MKRVVLFVITILLIMNSVYYVFAEKSDDRNNEENNNEEITEDILNNKNLSDENPNDDKDDSKNLLINSGFENLSNEDPQFWNFKAWFDDEEDISEFGVDNTVFRNGSKSVYIYNKKENHSRYTQTVNVESNKIYKISAFLKALNIGTENDGAVVFLEDSSAKTRSVTGSTKDWEYVEMYGLVPDGRTELEISLSVGGYGSLNTGKAWFDDVKVEKIDEVPKGVNILSFESDLSPNVSDVGDTKENKIIPIIIISLVFLVCMFFSIMFLFRKRKNKNSIGLDKGDEYLDLEDKDNSEEVNGLLEKEPNKIKIDKKDILIMSVCTFLYLLLALYNLGSRSVPETYWTPTEMNEYFTIDFEREINLSRISTYSGLGSDRDADGRFIVDYLNEMGKYEYLTTIEKEDIFILEYVNTPDISTTSLRFTVEEANGSINEFAIYEKNSTIPVKNFEINDYSISGDRKELDKLFDEQEKMDYISSFYNSMYFDEIYHGRTAFEFIHQIIPYENTHPPLGKVIMAFGVLIFGMVPFGWRIMGTLVGVAMLPSMYVFGKKMFKKRIFGFTSMFIMMFDFMHYTQTRIATIDSYVTLFVILMYYYMYEYFKNESYNIGYKLSLKPLFLSGLFFGLGAASKWIALYGAAGLALIYFLSKLIEFIEYKSITGRFEGEKRGWTKYFYKDYIFKTSLFCILFFVIIPVIIYFISYIPWIIMPDESEGILLPWKNSLSMYDYHSNLEATHPYQSEWWQWPIMSKPMAFYFGDDLPFNTVSKIFTMGNPAIWWSGILAFVLGIIVVFIKAEKEFIIDTLKIFIEGRIKTGLKVFILGLNDAIKKEKALILLYVAVIFQYAPWIIIPRCAFIYHFFSIVPFLILIIVYLLKELYENIEYGKILFYFYLSMVFVLFVLFFPVISGLEIPSEYTKILKWFDTWYF